LETHFLKQPRKNSKKISFGFDEPNTSFFVDFLPYQDSQNSACALEHLAI
jgi:hypothetical protein